MATQIISIILFTFILPFQFKNKKLTQFAFERPNLFQQLENKLATTSLCHLAMLQCCCLIDTGGVNSLPFENDLNAKVLLDNWLYFTVAMHQPERTRRCCR